MKLNAYCVIALVQLYIEHRLAAERLEKRGTATPLLTRQVQADIERNKLFLHTLADDLENIAPDATDFIRRSLTREGTAELMTLQESIPWPDESAR